MNRGGILNVYQYSNETLQFGGGRLLLRGANGTGKTTAMNMLLPFLLVARVRGLDAAGEQSGTQILRSWMLDGNEDRQPGGYLWLEFRRGEAFFACGVGLKANRSTGTVKQWWFAAGQRPGLDFSLLEDEVPLSEGQLRSQLEEGEEGQVFGERQRSDYRRLIEKRLFGGVPIDQHLRLLNRVRNPRVGDRVDVEIPQLLKDALPRLRDRILDIVARSLDELEEHHREVIGLEQTLTSLEGILDVYRSYCFSWLADARSRGETHIRKVRRVSKEHDRLRGEAKKAERHVEKLQLSIAELESDARKLSLSIETLKSSHAYRGIRELDTQRRLVATYRRGVADAETRARGAEARTIKDTEDLKNREAEERKDLNRINDMLDKVATIGRTHAVEGDPPKRIRLPDTGADLPVERISGATHRLETSIRSRKAGVSEVRAELKRIRQLEDAHRGIEELWKEHDVLAEDARENVRGRAAELKGAAMEWTGRHRSWANRVTAILGDAPLWATGLAGEAPSVSTLEEVETEREKLQEVIGDLIATRRKKLSALERQLSGFETAEKNARAVAEKWAALTEPELPYPSWQSPAGHCLADLIDFSPALPLPERAGLEAALEASGLLFSRPDDRSVVLANGELVAIPANPSPRPLGRLLSVQVPTRLRDAVNTDALEDLLGSLSTDPSDSDAPVTVATDGGFRIGSLKGRHVKERPEFIGEAARRETLNRGREEANSHLREVEIEHARAKGLLDSHEETVRRLEATRRDLPTTARVVNANARLNEAVMAAEKAEARLFEQAEKRDRSQQAILAAGEHLRVTARGLSLPYNADGLDRVWDDLESALARLEEVHGLLSGLERSVSGRNSAAARVADSENELGKAERALTQRRDELRSQEDQLSTLEESIGADERDIGDRLQGYQDDLAAKKTEIQETRDRRDKAVEQRAGATAHAKAADEERGRLGEQGEHLAGCLLEALRIPGVWGVLTEEPYPSDQLTPPIGVRRILATLGEYLPTHSGGYVAARGVYASVMQRRDRLGGGWDVEIRPPDDDTLPLAVEVSGPSGRTPIDRAVTTVRREHEIASGVLAGGQQKQLRDLLQGAIAKEAAERSHAATELVGKMRRRIQHLSTASDIGVDIEWRMDPSLDTDTRRMVELLSILPDTRTDKHQEDLERLLSRHLDRARAEDPEIGYKQALSEALDYKNWYRLQVKVRRENQPYKVLGRRNDLSEGEKKFVTYLPLFAAVAASCDSISETSEQTGTARFVLLDDAFAKVSSDNHAQLFGLLTDLDLDWVATSERLWGDHATIPELEIVEVIRDTELKAILLEKYRWNGRSRGEPSYD